MKLVRLEKNVVKEILPHDTYAKGAEYWYGNQFAEYCVEAPNEVEQGMVYDENTGNFTFPTLPPLQPTTEERIKALEAAILELILGGDA